MTRAQAMAYRKMIEKAVKSLEDDYALEAPELFERWIPYHVYKVGERCCFEGELYKCVQEHTSQPGWEPKEVPALWTKIADPSIEWPEWIQPTGAQDAYMIGDKVSHNDKHWVSLYSNNVWEPGVYGWEEQ